VYLSIAVPMSTAIVLPLNHTSRETVQSSRCGKKRAAAWRDWYSRTGSTSQLTHLQYYLVSWCARRYRQSRNTARDLLVVTEFLHLGISQAALEIISYLPPEYRNQYARYVLETYTPSIEYAPGVHSLSSESLESHMFSETLQNILRHSPVHTPPTMDG
jgi:hypothetical protein